MKFVVLALMARQAVLWPLEGLGPEANLRRIRIALHLRAAAYFEQS
jgi:hypothetical protein